MQEKAFLFANETILVQALHFMQHELIQKLLDYSSEVIFFFFKLSSINFGKYKLSSESCLTLVT